MTMLEKMQQALAGGAEMTSKELAEKIGCHLPSVRVLLSRNRNLFEKVGGPRSDGPWRLACKPAATSIT